MKFLHIFPFIFATTTGFVLNGVQLPNVKIEGRITRGEYASEGQFPHQVGLFLVGSNPNINWCGGVLIGTEWVLTAAHCLEYVKSLTVYLGSTVRQQAEIERYVSKDDFIIHHGYDSSIFRDDIALIKISPVTLSSKVNTIRLPSIVNKQNSLYENTFAIASGWGKISDEEHFVTDRLRWARFQVISNEECRNTFPFLPDSSLCLATPGRMSPCFGDSGGPLVSEEDGILIGTFSFLLKNGCELEAPVAYVRVTHYLDWIYFHTGICY